jgi:hypothetical protein
MKHPLATGFIGGCLGAIAAGFGDPGFVSMYRFHNIHDGY